MGTKSKHESDEPSLESLARRKQVSTSAPPDTARQRRSLSSCSRVSLRRACARTSATATRCSVVTKPPCAISSCVSPRSRIGAHVLRALCFSTFELRRFDAMLRCARRVTELLPQDTYGWQQLAIAQLEAGDAEASLEAASRALALNADNPYVQFCAAVARQVGGMDGAMDALEKAVALNPSFAVAMSEDKRLDKLGEQPTRAARLALGQAGRGRGCRGRRTIGRRFW